MAKSDQPGSKRAGRKKGSKTKRTTAGTARRTGKSAAPSRRKAIPPDPALAQVLEQQKATGEILQAIATAPADLDKVLQAVALNAARLCEADDAQIYRLQADKLHLAASQGVASAPMEASLDRGWVTGRSIIDRRTIHVPDLASESEEEYPIAKAMQREHGHRTTLSTPLLSASSALGAILIRRWDVNPFTEAQIGLLETFASQAVIAIENARIVAELETRNRELDDALEQQNAMAELLRAISGANGELKPVFETLLRNAIRLCEAEFGLLFLKEGDDYSVGAMFGVTDEFRAHMEGQRHSFGRGTATGRAVLVGKPVQIVDLKAETDPEDVEVRKTTVEIGGGRTIFSVPMMQDSQAIGAITIYRREVRPFADKQIELVSSFGNHAVIAIQNARLLSDLRDSLLQQTATADVLKTISSTAFDLDAVFRVLLRSALDLCDAFAGHFLVREDDAFVPAMQIGWPDEFDAYIRAHPTYPGRGSVSQRTALTGEVVHIPDVLADKEYVFQEGQKLAGYRTVLGAPLVRDGDIVGILVLARNEVRPFGESDIRLVRTFCDQAVIALQNARLLQELHDRNDEVSEALDQQTATAEILRVISTSPTDTQPVFETIARHATRLCRGQYCNVFRFDGELLHFVAHHGSDQKKRDIIAQAFPDKPGMGTAAQRTILKQAIVQIPDIASDPDYRRIDVAEYAKFESIIGVPMMRGDQPIGAITVMRPEAGTFPERHIELLRTFAEQAVIAIENVRLFTELDARNRALAETLDQQTATAEILRAISTSPTDTQPVFDAIAHHAATLCRGEFCNVFRFDGELVHFVAHHGSDKKAEEIIARAFPDTPGMGSAAQRTILKQAVVQIPDIASDPDYRRIDIAEYTNFHSIVGVPMMRGDQPIGAITVMRSEAGTFPDRHVELLRTFAEQAVIAIENVRLFTELDARNRALAETLEQQKATSEILRAISTSPTDTQPVFDAIARHAANLCNAQFCFVFRFDGEQLHFVAHHGVDQKGVAIVERAFPAPPNRDSAAQRSILERAIAQIEDVQSDTDYARNDISRHVHYRSIIAVPMMRDGQAIGTISLARAEVGAFPQRQVELLQTFAEQAVIAIENVRLFTELNARNSDLAETLEQQKATSEILSVISSSPTDAQPVFDTIVRNAVSLCGCLFANVFRFDGEKLHYLASHNIQPGYRDMLDEKYPMRPDRTQVSGRTILAGSIVHLEDALADPDYDQRWPEAAGWRSMLGVPMMRDGVPIGALVLGWGEPGPIADAQVNLIQTFADQAVIAIENVRLFTELNARNRELRKTLDRQTATAEVLKTISRSTFDLETVLQELTESAVRLCNADHGTIAMKKDGIFYRAINYGLSPEFAKVLQDQPVEIQRGTAAGRALLNGEIVHIHDVELDPDYTFLEAKTVGGLRTVLAVPMLREGEAIGVFAVTRGEVDPFTDEEIELVSTFADQAAIAIENVRLYESVEARSQELARSLEELRNTQDRLVQTEKLASLGQLTAGIAHEIKNPLNFVNNFASVSVELLDELLEDLESVSVEGDRKAAIDELAEMLNGNLAKIAEHGRRADSIVKNMLMHARQGSNEHRTVEINPLVDESLNLAYHGARAEKQGFNIEIGRDFDPTVGEADIYPQEITRVLLNLISNGFYAASKKGETRDGFEPRLTVSTRGFGDRVEIRVRDNGPGIDRETRNRLFSPFFTTKPVGEGTGLGLSISHDIIVKQHGGTIEVDSEPGEYCEFRIEIPRDAAGRTAGAAK